jgi:hypothetical protein
MGPGTARVSGTSEKAVGKSLTLVVLNVFRHSSGARHQKDVSRSKINKNASSEEKVPTNGAQMRKTRFTRVPRKV